MSHNADRLFELLRERSFLHKEVTLSSGQKSDYYIDGKMVEVYPAGAYLIGEVLFERIRDLQIDAIGGLAIGAVPLVAATVVSCWHHGRSIEGFWVREEPKGHGTQKLIEGKLPESARVVIVDDVVTSGSSVMKAISAIRKKGARVVKVIALVDRESGARELFEKEGYEYDPIFISKDFFANAHS